jgi:hypothetical protein
MQDQGYYRLLFPAILTPLLVFNVGPILDTLLIRGIGNLPLLRFSWQTNRLLESRVLVERSCNITKDEDRLPPAPVRSSLRHLSLRRHCHRSGYTSVQFGNCEHISSQLHTLYEFGSQGPFGAQPSCLLVGYT